MLARARLPVKKLTRKRRCCAKLAGDQWSLLGQYRIILSADTASEVRQLLSQKRR